MGREIKFRAWHPGWGDMIYSSKIALFEKREFYPFAFEVGFSYYPQDGQWVIMQYTGLKDTNDKEIYEGDVVHLFGHESEFVYAVTFRNGAFIAEHGDGDAGLLAASRYTVIGNVFENPGLD